MQKMDLENGGQKQHNSLVQDILQKVVVQKKKLVQMLVQKLNHLNTLRFKQMYGEAKEFSKSDELEMLKLFNKGIESDLLVHQNKKIL